MASYTANNKLLYSWNKGVKHVRPELLSSYAESIILDGVKRTLWHKGWQFGNSYYGSVFGENFNDFQHNTAAGAYSHAEGSHSTATFNGIAAHAEGIFGVASAIAAAVQGAYNYAGGLASHAEGSYTTSYGDYSHTEGLSTYSNSVAGHAEGYATKATSSYAHAEGEETAASGKAAHAEGYKGAASGNYSHSEGNMTTASAVYSHTEGESTTASGQGAHAEGKTTRADAPNSHAEGTGTQAKGTSSHTEGHNNVAEGNYSHVEGHSSFSGGIYSHAEGEASYSLGRASHAEGFGSYAVGDYSHAEGLMTYAVGGESSSQGIGTQAYNSAEAAFGSYNKSSTANGHKTIFSIGDGTSYSNRHNVVEVNQSYSYVANKSYFGDYVFAPLTYSYVDYTGPDKALNLIIKGLLGEEKYTKPVVYSKFIGSSAAEGTWDFSTYAPSYLGEAAAVSYAYMEIGSYFHPGVHIYWPDADDDLSLATRMAEQDQSPDYATIASCRTGYSYGLLNSSDAVSFYYDKCTSWLYEKTDADQEYAAGRINSDLTPVGFTYILAENDYEVINGLSLSYKGSSHMLYEKLKRVGLYQISYGDTDPYFGPGVIEMPHKLIVKGRYKWYCGFSNYIPQCKEDLQYMGSPVSSGFLEKNEEFSYTMCEHVVSNLDSRASYFWCAAPAQYFNLTPYNNRMHIIVNRGNGLNFDLVTDVQPINTASFIVNLGMNNDRFQKRYTVYYIKFKQSPLGDDENDIIKFAFTGSTPVSDGMYLLTEDGMPYGREDNSGRILYDKTRFLDDITYIVAADDSQYVTENSSKNLICDQ